MKNKLLLTIPLIALLASCGSVKDANYARCERIDIIGIQEMNNIEPVKTRIAKYECSKPIENTLTPGFGENNNIFYAAINGESNINFNDNIDFCTMSPQGYEMVSSAKLIGEIGIFKSYREIYYAYSIRTVKTIEVRYEDEKIYNETLYGELLDSPKWLGIYTQSKDWKNDSVNVNYYNYLPFEKSSITTYIDIGDSMISYTLYSNK